MTKYCFCAFFMVVLVYQSFQTTINLTDFISKSSEKQNSPKQNQLINDYNKELQKAQRRIEQSSKKTIQINKTSSQSDYDQEGRIQLDYRSYIKKYKPEKYNELKVMSDELFQMRMNIYNANVQKINKINQKYAKNKLPTRLGLNRDSDVMQKQFNEDKVVINLAQKIVQSIKNPIQKIKKIQQKRTNKIQQLKKKRIISSQQAQQSRVDIGLVSKILNSKPNQIIPHYQSQSIKTNVVTKYQSQTVPIFSNNNQESGITKSDNRGEDKTTAAPPTIYSPSKTIIQETTVRSIIKAPIPIAKDGDINWMKYSGQVKNQGRCNSCYAFSALETIEISIRIINSLQNKNNSDGPFSIQQIVSCTEQNFGCSGGTVSFAYYYIMVNGIGLQSMYPYELQTKQSGYQFQCNQDIINKKQYKRRKFRLKSPRMIKNYDCEQLRHILRFQAISVAVSSNNFQFYGEGILTTQNNKTIDVSEIDHQVTLVGFINPNIYIIKNQWGPKWGYNGFAYVTQKIGICIYAIHPIFYNLSPDFEPPQDDQIIDTKVRVQYQKVTDKNNIPA